MGLHRVATWLDPQAAALARRLVHLAVRGLPRMLRRETDEFAFTQAVADHRAVPGDHAEPRNHAELRNHAEPGDHAEPRNHAEPVAVGAAPDQKIALELRGTSLRYAAIVALGAHHLDEARQRQVLGGNSLDEFLTILVRQAAYKTNLGDAALVCWATAQRAHADLTRALELLRARDTFDRPEYVVEAAWVVSALASARRQADVEAHLTRARGRLLGSVLPGSPIFPHATAPGLVKPYRTHVACFADQVYPIQALARLHHSDSDREALRAAGVCAALICQAQGEGGQWWWHYDARTGAVIEGYPVYTVHQHAMAPMALLDLAEAGGTAYRESVNRGMSWIISPAELGAEAEPMILDDEAVTWRKVYRGDPHKVVRGLHTVTTRAVRGMRVPGVGLVYPPKAIDRECRPYELGWLLFTWLGGLAATPGPTPDSASFPTATSVR